MKRMHRHFALCALAAGLGGPAWGADHLMVVQEVFPGTPSNPAAQYVMLRMTASGQNLLNGDFVEVQDAAGAVLGRFGTFTSNAPNGGTIGCSYGTCPPLVMGTLAAQTALGFTFDLVVDGQAGRASLPLGGGRVCFRTGTTATSIADCVAWGSFSSANTIATPTINGCDANFGAPAPALAHGFALTRKTFSCAAKDNAVDFENRFPHPVANNGGNANADSDADGLINVLDCDDASGASLYPPVGVAALDVTGGLTAGFSWSQEPAPAGTSLVYDLAQMRRADLDSAGSCNAAAPAGTFITGAGVTATSFSGSDDPGVGSVYYYVVRSRTTCGGSPFC
jgi:hypothetical protein